MYVLSESFVLPAISTGDGNKKGTMSKISLHNHHVIQHVKMCHKWVHSCCMYDSQWCLTIYLINLYVRKCVCMYTDILILGLVYLWYVCSEFSGQSIIDFLPIDKIWQITCIKIPNSLLSNNPSHQQIKVNKSIVNHCLVVPCSRKVWWSKKFSVY